MTPFDVAIIGGGFSGLLSAYHVIKNAPAGLSIGIFEPRAHLGQGLAYSTKDYGHLLNVPASNMSALAADPDHFLNWLNSRPAQDISKTHNLKTVWRASDYAPRILYGYYLTSLSEEAQQISLKKNIQFTHVKKVVSEIKLKDNFYSIKTDDSETFFAKKLILALGNVSNEQNPDFKVIKESKLPIVIIGTGLTMIDALISIRNSGYLGLVTAVSRNGRLPAVSDDLHQKYETPLKKMIGTNIRLSNLIHLLKKDIAESVRNYNSWQPSINSVRSVTSALWQSFSSRQKKIFFSRLFSLWNVHRHRMAPEIGAYIQNELHEGTLRIIKGHAKDYRGRQDVFVLDCTGPSYNYAQSNHSLIKNIIKNQIISTHETGWGIARPDEHTLFALGPPLIGEYLETTAVPELRVQAQEVASKIFSVN